MPDRRFEARVQTVLSRFDPGASVPRAPASQALPLLCAWLDKLLAWNARMDLTAARSDDELVDLMVADAALLATHLPPGASVVDVGTGAGAPGLALAMLRPDLRLTLVEPLGRRATFLRLVAGMLPKNAVPRVSGERVEALAGAWQVALSRATLPPQSWLEQGARLAPAGEVWVLLARLEAPALAGWQCSAEVGYRWPLTGAERRALCFRPQAGAS